MRKYCAVILGLVVVLAGCSATSPIAVISGHPGASASNMVFGPRASSTAIATRMTGRSAWPRTETGYRFNDVTHYSRSTYDYQHGYDGNQGVFHESHSVEYGTRVR